MQQIASGGAMDNANFQPLGTIDWLATLFFIVTSIGERLYP